jgi:hypothetical protein
MLKHPLGIALPFLLLLATSGTGSAQQNPSEAAAQADIKCGGQYECVEDRPLTPEEARASRGYPQVAEPQEPVKDPTKVATTPPATTN